MTQSGIRTKFEEAIRQAIQDQDTYQEKPMFNNKEENFD